MPSERVFDFHEVFVHESELMKKWNHLNFRGSGEMPIWHYTTADRLLRTITNKIVNLGSLKSMDDKHEGDFPNVVRGPAFWDGYDDKKIVLDHIGAANGLMQKIFIQCWTARQDEHEGFWRAFTDLKTGIAIRSSVSKLNAAKEISNLKHKEKRLELHYVKYANFERMAQYRSWKELNFMNYHGAENQNAETELDGRLGFGRKYFPAQVKRHSFFHEREVRLIAINEALADSRLELHFDWQKVIEEIYLAPKIDDTSADELISKLRQAIDCPVSRSKAYKC